MNHTTPVIIFGDYIAAYGAIRGLSQYDIPIYIVSKTGKGMSTKSRFVKGVLQLDPKDVDFIDKLDNWFAREIGVEAILMVAGDDDYLDTLAKAHDQLRPEMKTTFPNWEIVKLVREKRRTYRLAEELGIPVPKTYYITSLAELESLLNNKEEKLCFPMFMKPESDSRNFLHKYGIKGIVCENKEELLRYYQNYDAFGGQLILQDMIPGEEGKHMNLRVVLNRKSQPLGVFFSSRRRSSQQFQSPTIVGSAWSDTVLDYSLQLLSRIGYYGFAALMFKLDPRDGQFKLIEINGRITMSNSLSLKCGVNLPYLMYQEALHGPLPCLEELKQDYPDNILWWFLAEDMVSVIRHRTFLKPRECIKSMIGNGYVIEPMYWRDPYPGIRSVIGTCMGACLAGFRTISGRR